MFEVENTGQPAGAVVQVLQPGYILHDRLLRPAMVGVAKAGPGAPSRRGASTRWCKGLCLLAVAPPGSPYWDVGRGNSQPPLRPGCSVRRAPIYKLGALQGYQT